MCTLMTFSLVVLVVLKWKTRNELFELYIFLNEDNKVDWCLV